MINTKKTKSTMKIKPVGKEAFPIKTKPDYPQCHFLLTAYGKRGSGKTTSVSSLINEGVKDKVFDEVFIVTPTYHSNADMFLQFGNAFDPDTNVVEPTKDTADHIEEFVNGLAEYYDDYLDKMEIYNELKKKKHNLEVDEYNDFIEMGLMDDMGNIMKPEYKYHNKPPRAISLIDDCVGTSVFIGLGAKKMTSLALKHRHIAPMRHGGVLGVSLCLLSQTIATQMGSIPRAVRENSTHVIIVGKTKDENKQKQMYDELGDGLEKDDFMLLWDFATMESPHDFLFLDYNPKKGLSPYRKNFDTYISLKNLKTNKKEEKSITNEDKQTNKEKLENK